MAECGQGDARSEGCIPNVLLAAYLDPAFSMGQQQVHIEHSCVLAHSIPTVALLGRKAKQDHEGLREVMGCRNWRSCCKERVLVRPAGSGRKEYICRRAHAPVVR